MNMNMKVMSTPLSSRSPPSLSASVLSFTRQVRPIPRDVDWLTLLFSLLVSQVRILSSLSHSNIIEYLCAYHRQEQPAALCILTTYAEGGSLEQAITKQSEQEEPFGCDRVLTWAVQLTAALAHVHEQHIMHRDLKSANVRAAPKHAVPARADHLRKRPPNAPLPQ